MKTLVLNSESDQIHIIWHWFRYSVTGMIDLKLCDTLFKDDSTSRLDYGQLVRRDRSAAQAMSEIY